MPKRPNPFGDCSPLQFKQHVGRKEVDMGVCQHDSMKQVYERTKELLFFGSKKSFDPPVDANCNNIYTGNHDVQMGEMSNQGDGQMRLNTDGQLCPDITDTKPKDAFQALMMRRKESSRHNCQCCKGQAASQDRCGFCEKSICYDCVRSCESCDGNFCQLCSVMNPDDVIQRWYCQQCSYRLNPFIHWLPSY